MLRNDARPDFGRNQDHVTTNPVDATPPTSAQAADGATSHAAIAAHQGQPVSVASPKIPTMHDLIRKLERRSPSVRALRLRKHMPDAPLTGDLLNFGSDAKHRRKACKGIEALAAARLQVAAPVANLLSERLHYGAFAELATYGWLATHGVSFRPQVWLGPADVLNPNGCEIDGALPMPDAFFDIKAFGFLESVVGKFKRLIEDRTGLLVELAGPMDVSVKDVETHAFPAVAAAVADLRVGRPHTIAALGWTIVGRKGMSMAVSTVSPYRMAEENRHYPFKTARQFARTKPFLLVFAHSCRFTPMLSVNFGGSTDVALRSLARRAFMQFTNNATPLTDFDKGADPAATLGQASALLSALLFLDLDTDDARLFLNPRAAHPFDRGHLEWMFDFTLPRELKIDDFAHDDY